MENEAFDDDFFSSGFYSRPIFPSNLQCSTRFSLEWCMNFLFLLVLTVPARFNIQGIKIQFKSC